LEEMKCKIQKLRIDQDIKPLQGKNELLSDIHTFLKRLIKGEGISYKNAENMLFVRISRWE